ncbi:MAG: type IV pilus assembly protein PilM [Patescibacteria group bacterium]|nr:type IV pilus assembly protein PilM [Patescibacteria group bacterium]
MGLFSPKQKSYLGIDLGAGGVKVVELRQEKGRPVLFTYGLTSSAQDVHKLLAEKRLAVEDIKIEQNQNIRSEKTQAPTIAVNDERIDRYAEVIKAVCHEAKTVSKIATVSLPVSAVFHSIVTMPKVDQKEFMGILKAEVKKLLPYPIEDMVLDHQVLENFSTEKNKKILVSAVPKSIVDFYARVFQRAGLSLESLEPESASLSRSLIGRDTAVTMLIDMGAERTNLFIIDQSVPITHHTIESGGNKINKILQNALGVTDEALASQMKHDLYKHSLGGKNGELDKAKFVSLLNPVIDPIIKQIDYSFNLYFSQSGNESKRPEKIVLTGGSAMMPYLAEHLAETFKIKCYLGDPWARVVYQDKLKPLLNEIGPRMSVAIGLALKNLV